MGGSDAQLYADAPTVSNRDAERVALPRRKAGGIVDGIMAGNFFQTLGLAHDASDEEIRKAYRKLVFQYHPDRNPESPEAEAKIRELNEAYEVLSDPETRRAYERLVWGTETRVAGPDPGIILEQMETTLYDEGRREVYEILMKNIPRIKSELGVIRERTVARQGYDSFKRPVVAERGAEILSEFCTEEMEQRRRRLIAVAVAMMVSQGVVMRDDEPRLNAVRDRLDESFRKGRINGFGDALEMFYVRR